MVKKLVAQIDALLETLQRANSEVQQMRDEIARLKGQKARPKFKSSKMDENADRNKVDDDDEGASPQDGEKSKRAGSAKRSEDRAIADSRGMRDRPSCPRAQRCAVSRPGSMSCSSCAQHCRNMLSGSEFHEAVGAGAL